MKIIETTQAPAAVGPYSQGIEVNGFIYFSGQIALNTEGQMIDGGVEDQTIQVFKNIDALLRASGSQRGDIVKALVFLQDINDFDRVNKLYAAFFENHRPARSCVEVSALPKGAKVEIEVIVRKG